MQQAYDRQPTLPNAVLLAASLRDGYSAQVSDSILLDRSTALLLITAAGIATGLGSATSTHSAVLGLTLGGAAGYTAETYINSKPQQIIYAAGANAVQCAIDATQPLQIAYGERAKLADLLQTLRGQIGDLEVEISRSGPAVSSPDIERGKANLTNANALYSAGNVSLETLDKAGGALSQSVMAIKVQVGMALATSTPNLQSLASGLSASLPSLANQLGGAPAAQALPKKPTGEQAANFDPAANRKIEATITALSALLDRIHAAPATDVLKNCGVDTQKLGLAMRVAPSGAVTAEISDASPSKNVGLQVSGGAIPYSYIWLAEQPDPSVVKVSFDSGNGLAIVTVGSGTAAGDYVLQFSDAAGVKTSATLHVVSSVTAKDKQGAGAAGAAPAAPKCKEDADVKQTQTFLLAQKGADGAALYAKVQVGGASKTLIADGCMGPTTRSAAGQYLEAQKVDTAGLSDQQLVKSVLDIEKALPPASAAPAVEKKP